MWSEGRLRIRDSQVGSPLVRKRQQPSDPSSDGVLGHRRIGERTQVLQRGLTVLDPQPSGSHQVFGHVIPQDLQGALHTRTGRDCCPRRPAQIRVVEVSETIGGRADLAPHAPFLPREDRLVCTQAGEECPDGIAVTDDDPVHATYLPGLRSDAQAAEIVELAEKMRGSIADPAALMEHDLAFHTALARASRNPVYSLLIGSFQGITRQTWPVGWKSRQTRESRDLMVATHAEIARAVAAGDPEKATTAMSLHFDESVRALLTAGLS